MNFDVPPLVQSNHIEPQDACQNCEGKSLSFQPLPDTLDDFPSGSPIAQPTRRLVALASPHQLSQVPEETVTKKAVACVIAEVSKTLCDKPVELKSCVKEQKLEPSQNAFHKQVHYAPGTGVTDIDSAPAHELPINVITCSRDELNAFILTNKEKSYFYKLRAMVDQVERYCSSKNLSVAEIREVKSRLDSFASQRPYTIRQDLGTPSQLEWPPYKITTRSNVSSLRVEITRLYVEAYGHLLVDIDDLLATAQRTSDKRLEKECHALIKNELYFPFSELLAFAVATDHFTLLEKVFPDCVLRVREAVNDMLDRGDFHKLQFMQLQGGEGMKLVQGITQDIFLLYQLEQAQDVKTSVNILYTFIRQGGDILHCYADNQDVLTAYATSEIRNREVMNYLFIQAEMNIRSRLDTIDYKNDEQCSLLVDYIQRLAEVPDLNPACKQFVSTAASQVLQKAYFERSLLSEAQVARLDKIVKANS